MRDLSEYTSLELLEEVTRRHPGHAKTVIANHIIRVSASAFGVSFEDVKTSKRGHESVSDAKSCAVSYIKSRMPGLTQIEIAQLSGYSDHGGPVYALKRHFERCQQSQDYWKIWHAVGLTLTAELPPP